MKHFNKQKRVKANQSEANESRKKPGKLRRAWNGLVGCLRGIIYVITKAPSIPGEILRKIVPSLDAGQVNCILVVLLIVFAYSVYRSTTQMHGQTVEMHMESRSDFKEIKDDMKDVKNMLVDQKENQEKMQGSVYAVHGIVSQMQEVAKATLQRATEVAKGASKLAGKAVEFAGEAAQFAGSTYQNFKTWVMGGWLTSAKSADGDTGHSSSESGTV